MPKRAFITGITGQDGSYLSELLLAKGYEVHGLIRRSSTFNTHRIDHIYEDPHHPDARLFLHYGDLAHSEQITHLIYNLQPDEVYHLGAQSHVRVSFDTPEYTGDTTGLGTTRLLEAILRSGIQTRFYNAASSEMFGSSPPPQNERTPLHPRSPYAAAKAYSYWMTRMYREGHHLFAVNGILFNHESPRRGETFVTRKITQGLAAIVGQKQPKLYLGNLEAKRDWGHAKDYVRAMHLMLQRDEPDDYVVATGETHTVREFCELAFGEVGLDYREYVRTDERFLRPAEVDLLVGDATKARRELGWVSQYTFPQLVSEMVQSDLRSQTSDQSTREGLCRTVSSA